VRQLAARWVLDVGARFAPTPGSPGNFVAPATRADGTPVVLKVSTEPRATSTEIEALRIWDGVGAARLLESDADLGALLLERVEPGTMLAEVADDDETVRVAASLLRRSGAPAATAPPTSHVGQLVRRVRAQS